MSEYTAKRARTRGQLLAAGQEMLPGSVRRGLEHALGPGPVTLRAGLSRQTWYRYWRADDSGYLDELTRTALDTVHLLLGPMLGRLHPGPSEGALAEAEPAEMVLRDVARAHLGLVTQRRVALVQLMVATLAVEDQFLEAESGIRPTAAPAILRSYFAHLTDALTGLYGTVLDRWGRVPSEPHDLRSVVGLVAALADGYGLRLIAESDPDAGDRFADAVTVTLSSLTRPAGPHPVG